MARRGARAFHCTVVDEEVQIRLSNKRIGGFSGTTVPFVQCDQRECQYVDDNADPCPLRADMFADEIEARKKQKEEPPIW